MKYIWLGVPRVKSVASNGPTGKSRCLKMLNQIQNEVSKDIQSSSVEAADIQHASVIRVCDRETVGGHATNHQLSRNTHFLEEGEQNISENTSRVKHLHICSNLNMPEGQISLA